MLSKSGASRTGVMDLKVTLLVLGFFFMFSNPTSSEKLYLFKKLNESDRTYQTALPLSKKIGTIFGNRAYFNSTVAPASSNSFFIFSASSFGTASLTVLGAPSTNSLASFKPRPV